MLDTTLKQLISRVVQRRATKLYRMQEDGIDTDYIRGYTEGMTDTMKDIIIELDR